MRIALVGYGGYAPKHLEVLRALGAEVVASSNRSEAGRARAQAEGGIPRTYARTEEMLERERPDGVVSCVSFEAQHAVGKVVIASGIPFLIEKPPGTSLAELEELVALARTHGTPVMVGLNRRHYSVIRRALDDAGGPEAVRGVFIDWSEDPAMLLGRGMAADLVAKNTFRNSIHGLDLLTFLGGDLPDPTILATSQGAPFQWVQSVSGVSARGAVASFTSTWNAPGRWRVQFVTDGRRYTFAPLETCKVAVAGQKDERTIEPDEHDRTYKAGMYRQAERFLEMITTRTPPLEAALEVARPAMTLAERLTAACRA